MSEKTPSTATCPLCGQDNQCAMAAGAASNKKCWCWDATLDDTALAAAKSKTEDRCICPSCGKVGTEPDATR